MTMFKHYLPTLGQSWLLVLIFLAVGNLLAALCALPFMLSGNDGQFPFSVMYIISMLPPLWWAARQSRKAALWDRAAVPLHAPDYGNAGVVGAVAASVIAVLALGIIMEPVTTLIPMPEAMKKIFEETFDNSTDSIIAAVILAPICEELFCRGLILRGLLSTRTPLSAILWSAFIFAFIHMNPWQGIAAFSLGCLMGWVYYRTHSLLLCMLMHFTNNSLAMVMQFIFPEAEADDTLMSLLPSTTYWIIYIGAIFAAVFAITLLNKKLNGKEEIISFKVSSVDQA